MMLKMVRIYYYLIHRTYPSYLKLLFERMQMTLTVQKFLRKLENNPQKLVEDQFQNQKTIVTTILPNLTNLRRQKL